MPGIFGEENPQVFDAFFTQAKERGLGMGQLPTICFGPTSETIRRAHGERAVLFRGYSFPMTTTMIPLTRALRIASSRMNEVGHFGRALPCRPPCLDSVTKWSGGWKTDNSWSQFLPTRNIPDLVTPT